MSTRWRSRLRLIGDQRSVIGKKCGVAASASKPTNVHSLALAVRAKSSQRATAVARHRGVPLSRPVEEYFDRLAPAAGQHDSEAFFAWWQGAFKIDPAALKDERVAAIMAKHVPDRARACQSLPVVAHSHSGETVLSSDN